jgi:hypothetical protein
MKIAGESTSSQQEQESEDSNRVPTEDDLESDNWKYLKDFFVMSQTPVGTYRNCAYQCKLCIPRFKEVKASKTTYDALKNHISNHHKPKENEFLALIGKGVNHNKRRKDSEGIVSSPAVQQKTIKDYQGMLWGKPGQLVSNKQMDDDIVDLFVDNMLPLMVSASKLSHYCVQSPPLMQACFWE